MPKPRVGFAGTSGFAQIVLRGMLQADWDIPVVITQPDKPAGRSQKRVASPVALLAQERSLTLLQPQKISEAQSVLKAAILDVLVVAAYGQLLPPVILEAAARGSLNVHGSILPAYRGASPIQHALLDGLEHTGVTIMQMDEGLDTGPILATQAVAITPEDTAGSLSENIAVAGRDLLVATVPRYLSGSLTPHPQGESPTPLTRLIQKSDGAVDWNLPAIALERLTRAMHPWPSATCFLDGQPVKILASSAEAGTGEPGVAISRDPLLVGTSSGLLRIRTLQLAGKQPQIATDFMRGYRGAAVFSGTTSHESSA